MTLHSDTAIALPEIFDVIIVGSGVSGGTAAQQFCEAGLRVLVLEAGRPVTEQPLDASIAAAIPENPIQAKCYAYGHNTRRYFVNDADDPYSTPDDLPFAWIRVRALGGKSLLWAGHCYRMSDLEFQAANDNGSGGSWPLAYKDIRPYYDQAERILQVQDADNFHPQTDGKPSTAGTHLRAAFAAKGYKLVPARVSHSRAALGDRKPCIHCGETTEECLRPVSSLDSTLEAAKKTGLLTLWPQARARIVVTDSTGKATGIAGRDQRTGERFMVRGRIVFLCASPLESARILLNSASDAFPNGLGNSSGVVGHYLMDHVSGIVLTAICPGFTQRENSRAEMFYVPRNPRTKNAFGYQGFILRADHELLPCGRARKRPEFKMESSHLNSAVQVRLAGFGEMLPHYDNYVEIDRSGKTDADGFPPLRVHCRLRENETALAQAMASTGLELLHAAGATVTDVQSVPSEPGLAIHEAGTCRMGDNPRTSVLNRFNQCHDVPNLFVTDASCFPGIGTQNPVLTVMALTLRASEYALRQLSHGAI